MRHYSRRGWGITSTEYEMLCEALKQRICFEKQVEDNRILSIRGAETVDHSIRRLNFEHRFFPEA